MKIDKEKFIKDIEKDLGIKKYEEQVNTNDDFKKKINDSNFEDLGDFFKEIFEKNQGYQSNVLDIEGTCKISKEEAKKGCEREIKIKRNFFDKKENKLKNKKVKIRVKIPKEIKQGQSILIYGEGNEHKKLNKGNLLVKIVIKNN